MIHNRHVIISIEEDHPIDKFCIIILKTDIAVPIAAIINTETIIQDEIQTEVIILFLVRIEYTQKTARETSLLTVSENIQTIAI